LIWRQVFARPSSGIVHLWPDSEERSLSGKRILVTGATGFLGAHLVARLVEVGSHVVALIRPASNLWRIQHILDRVEIVPCDLSHPETANLESSLSDVQVVYHLAAAGVDQSYQDAASIMQTNVMGTLRLLQLARTRKVERFVYCGSCSEYGPGTRLSEDSLPAPTSEYGASKSAAWMLARTFFQRYGLPVVSLRPFNAYGPLEAANKLIPHLIIKAIENSKMELTGGEQTRDFVFVDDVVGAFLAAAVIPDAVGGTFNVCTGLATSIKEVASAIVELTGSAVQPLFGAVPYRDTEIWTLSGDPGRARHSLGWSARTSLRNGLDKTMRWFREHRSRYPMYRAS